MTDTPDPQPAPPALPKPLTLPYLTADLPGIGGRLKERPEDFAVEEIPAYEPGGEGTHTYFCLQKKGIDTPTAIRRIAGALGRPRRDFGYAGLKDRHAVTRQVISIEHVEPERIEALEIADLQVVWVSRHTNKLRLGHLRGNRFRIRVRGVGADRVTNAQAILKTLAARGIPNYFGKQRFGVRGTGHQMGLALLRNDNREFLSLLLGRPDPEVDYGPMLKARVAFEERRFEDARKAWPPYHRDERAALATLVKSKGSGRAVRAVDKHLRRFLISALQSFLFNRVLERRLDTVDRLFEGDLAQIHGHGAVFRVEDPAAEQPRCERLEISPSGPLYGYKMTWPTGEQEAIERAVIDEYGIDPAWFGQGGHHVRGDRRALRIPLAEHELSAGADEHGPYIEVAFDLPSGAYATVVLRELMKDEESELEEEEDDAE